MIIRIAKRTNPYVQIDKRPLEDARLSWRAKGVLAYLLSKPDGWQVKSEDILNHGTEGRDAVRVAMQELRVCGYARLDQTPRGREWVIIEEPCPENPVMEPCPEKANDGNSATSNNKGKESKNKSLAKLKTTDEEFWRTCAGLYPGLNIENQIARMKGWLLLHPRRQLTRRFAISWLNNQDTPLTTNAHQARNQAGHNGSHDSYQTQAKGTADLVLEKRRAKLSGNAERAGIE